MYRLLLIGALSLAAPARAQFEGAQAGLRQIQLRTTALRARTARAQVDPLPIERIFEKLMREGLMMETAEGKAVGIRDEYPAGSLTLAAVEMAPPSDIPEDEVYSNDLVYRFSHIVVNLSVASQFRKLQRVETWTYRVYFGGSLDEVEHQVQYIDSFGLLIPSGTKEDKIPADDPAAQKGWNELIPRLLNLTRKVTI